MKKLFGRDKPKAVKVTPGHRDDVPDLADVRSLSPHPPSPLPVHSPVISP